MTDYLIRVPRAERDPIVGDEQHCRTKGPTRSTELEVCLIRNHCRSRTWDSHGQVSERRTSPELEKSTLGYRPPIRGLGMGDDECASVAAIRREVQRGRGCRPGSSSTQHLDPNVSIPEHHTASAQSLVRTEDPRSRLFLMERRVSSEPRNVPKHDRSTLSSDFCGNLDRPQIHTRDRAFSADGRKIWSRDRGRSTSARRPLACSGERRRG